jgi:enamine deaminase RidA (YjgF/YER057c/UK114 family)
LVVLLSSGKKFLTNLAEIANGMPLARRMAMHLGAPMSWRYIVTDPISDRLIQLSLSLPDIPAPSANHLPYIVDGLTAYLAGQINELNGKPTIVGKIPSDYTIEDGQNASRVAALNLFACLRAACGSDIDRVDRCLSLRGFANTDPDFDSVPLLINGASNLFVEIFGDAGRHVRTAIGVATLPRNGVVEVDAIFRLRA